MEWTVEHEGEYTRAVHARPRTASTRSRVGGTDKDGKDVGRGDDDPRGAERRRVLRRRACARRCCKRVAEETDGRFFTAADTAALVDAITYSGKGITVVEEKELWDMPIVLLLLLT